MNWTATHPTVSGFYGYRDKGQEVIIFFDDGVAIPPDVIPGLPEPHVYFAKSATPVPVTELTGSFRGPITLPE